MQFMTKDKFRLLTLILINSCIVLLWVIHLFFIQVRDIHNLKNRKMRYKPRKEIQIPFRGNITDANSTLLATTIKNYQLDMDKQSIRRYCKRNDKNYDETLNRAVEIISDNSEISESDLKRKLKRHKNSDFIMLASSVKESDLLKIKQNLRAEHIPGINSTFKSMQRVYPKGALASRLIGATKENSADSGEEESLYSIKGVTGLEYALEKYLKGKYGWKTTYYDGNQQAIPDPSLAEKKVENGSTVTLTIDAEIQEILEKHLNSGIEAYNAKNALGVIMDPKTGNIIAMAGSSCEDSKKKLNEIRTYGNMPTSFIFEPGSTIKPITVLLALEKKLYQPEDMVDCRKYKLDRRVISDVHEFDELSVKDVIVHSSNVGVAKIVEKIGSKPFYKRLIELGFGHKTGINVSGESSGILRKLNKWQGFSLHSISFGQEIGVTALQLANAYCTLANGGKVMQPNLIKTIVDDEGSTVLETKPKVLRKISDKKSLTQLHEMLEGVVEYGTGIATRIENIRIAGKTGTAEKKAKGQIGYAEKAHTPVWAGFFPVEDPRLVVVIAFDEPDYKYHYASMSAVPTFKKVVEEILVLPDYNLLAEIKQENQETVTMPDFMNMEFKDALPLLDKNKLKYKTVYKSKSNTITNQFPKPDISFNPDNEILLVFGHGNDVAELESETMPDLVGCSLRKAVEYAKRNHVKLKIQGRGVVVKQSIPPKTKIEYGQLCHISAE